MVMERVCIYMYGGVVCVWLVPRGEMMMEASGSSRLHHLGDRPAPPPPAPASCVIIRALPGVVTCDSWNGLQTNALFEQCSLSLPFLTFVYTHNNKKNLNKPIIYNTAYHTELAIVWFLVPGQNVSPPHFAYRKWTIGIFHYYVVFF